MLMVSPKPGRKIVTRTIVSVYIAIHNYWMSIYERITIYQCKWPNDIYNHHRRANPVKEIRMLNMVTMISLVLYNLILIITSFGKIEYILGLLNIGCSSLGLIVQIGFITVKTLYYIALYKTYLNLSTHDEVSRKKYYHISVTLLILFQGTIAI